MLGATLPVLALMGCEEDRVIEPILTELSASEPEAIVVGQGVGRGEVTVPIRVVNAYGSALGATDLTLSVSGTCPDGTPVTLAEDEVSSNAGGYAFATAIAPCTTSFDVTVTDSSDGTDVTDATGTSYAYENRRPVIQTGVGAALPPEAKDPNFVAPGTRGIAIGVGQDIYWQSGDLEQPPHLVASLPADITGMHGAHVDADGVMDLVAWGGTAAFLLRGLDTGGYTWQGGWYVDADKSITGIALQDFDADRYTDIAIGTQHNTDLEGWVEVLFGSGSWSWQTTDVLEVGFPVASVTATDENHDGWADVTVLDGNSGKVRRYAQFEGGWVQGGPPEFIDPNGPYVAPEGSQLLPMVDLNHDDRADVIVNEAPGAGNHQLVFFILGEQGVTLYQRAYTVYYTTVADMNQDGADDILALEDYILHIIRDDLSLGDFLSQGVTGVGLASPLTAAFVDEDSIHDVAIVKEHANIYPGVLAVDDKTGEPIWEAQKYNWPAYTAGLTGPFVVADTNSNGLADVVGFTENNSDDTVVRSWNFSVSGTGETELSVNGAAGFVSTGKLTGHDIVRCGANYYALASEDGVTGELITMTVDGGGPTRTATLAVNGTMLACGNVADGANGVAVGTSAGAWTAYNPSLTKVIAGDVGDAGAIAAADQDGDGADEIVACTPAPCSIAAGDLDGDGIDEVVRGDEFGVSIEGWGDTTALPGVGAVSILDLDGDGYGDVVVSDENSGQLLVFRAVPGGLGPAVAYHTDEEIHGHGDVGDVTGDGIVEIIMQGAGGTLTHSLASVADAD